MCGLWSFIQDCHKLGDWVSAKFHRIVRVGRELWGSSGPNCLPTQGHLERVTQELVWVGFWPL